jgi:large subunit ribosomal protein L9
MQNQLLLLQDVEALGRSGDLVTVKPGYARNFLIPKKKAVVADKYTLRLRARLQEERAKQAIIDLKESEELASKYAAMNFSTEVKVDADGRMYGSVSAVDIVKLCEAEGINIDKKNIALPHPIKTVGNHSIQVKLKEGVMATLMLNVYGDREIKRPAPVVEVEMFEETETTETTETSE